MSKSFPIFCRILGSLFIMLAVNTGAFAYGSGSPSGYSGSPGDNKNCSNCHGGSTSTVTGWITSTVPTQGYTPGTVYTITAVAQGSGKKGFEVSPQSPTGTQLGVLTAGSNNHLVGGTKYVTQNSTGSSTSNVTYTFTWTAPAAGTGTVTFYGAFCISTSSTKLCTLVVNEYVPLSVNVTANPMTINSGQSSQLNAVAAGGSGSYTYSWTSVPAGFTSTQQIPVVWPTVTTQYTCTVNDGTSSVQGSVTVTVNAPVPLAVVVTATPSTVNPGQGSQLSASPSGGTGSYSYSWTSVPAGFASTQQNPVVYPTATTQYIVTVNDGVNSVQGDATVTVNMVPLTASAAAWPSDICAGQSSQLEVMAGGGTGSYTYSWTSNPAGFTSAVQNPVVSPAVTTQYFVTVSDGVNTANASTNVNVGQPATANAGVDTTCAYVTTEVPLNGTATWYSSVLWTTSGTGTFSAATALSGLYFPSTADKDGGDVTLTLTASAQYPCTNAASDARVIHFDGPTGLAEGTGNVAFGISPNPSRGSFIIRLSGAAGESEITISDLAGRTVARRSVAATSGSERFDLSGSSKGLYFVTVRTDAGSAVQKLVIE